jgi:uncharacterized protein YfaT (DUF1175 family)
MRTVPRWLAVSAVFTIAAVACAFTLRHAVAPSTLLVKISEPQLPADGFSSAEIKVHSSVGRELRDLTVTVSDPHRGLVEFVNVAGDTASASVRAGVIPGEVNLRVAVGGFAPRELTLRTYLDSGDSFGDGTPDFLRLHDAADKQTFRRWFTFLAESQYYKGKNLPAEIDDCAALARFAYREALREHDAAWAKAMALPVGGSSGIRQYQYPYTPLGGALFRVREGRFAASDIEDGAFAEFADVKTLWHYNTHLVSRDLGHALPGDLLLFRHDGKMPFHAMIFLGRSQTETSHEEFVVYHTGPTGKLSGEIRRLSTMELLSYPDARWRPIPSNPGFLGIYRWNILRGDD